MKINLLIFGTRGDVQPATALGVGLKNAGCEVRLGALAEFKPFVEACGLGFIPLPGDIQALMGQAASRKMVSGAFFFKLIKLFQKVYQDMFREFWQVSQGCDLLISNAATAMMVDPVAEKLRIPHIETSVFPGWPTRAFPSFWGNWPDSLWVRESGLTGRIKGAVNWFSYKPVNWVLAVLMQPLIARCRREILGLPGKGLPGKKPPVGSPPAPVLAGFSQHIVPRPADWAENIHVTGYWHLETPAFEPPPALQAFLDVGAPPVYVGFGSMPSQDPAQTSRLVCEARALAGQRGILLTGYGPMGSGMGRLASPHPVYFVDSIPHEWLLPRTAAAVHHGGAGTTAAGIRAGIPSVLVPILGDQRLWAYRVEALGIGPKPVPRSRLNAERLAAAITQAVSDPALRQRAAALGEKIRAEDGVGEAVRIIRQYAGI